MNNSANIKEKENKQNKNCVGWAKHNFSGSTQNQVIFYC